MAEERSHTIVSHVSEGQAFNNEWSHIPITFGKNDPRLKKFPHTDPLVITAVMGKNSTYLLGSEVAGILVDIGSLADIITYKCF